MHEEIHQKYESTFENPDFYDQDELFRMYRQTLEKMPKDIRETFLMNRDRSLTHKEIAATLNVSPQTVNYRIGQALKMLRQALKDYLPFWSILLSSLI